MIKRIFSIALVMVLSLSMLVACGDNRTGSQILEDAVKKSMEVKSMATKGFIDLNLNFSDAALQSMGPDSQIALQYLKNIRISYEGAYTVKPMEGEVTLSTELPIGDLKTKIDLPILFKDKKIWVKVPQLPMPELQQLAGKFIELDLNELEKMAASSGQTMPPFDELQATTKKLYGEELYPLFFKTYGETYMKKGDLKNVEVPKEVKAKQVVDMEITQKQLDAVITTFLKDFAPKAVEILSKAEYQKVIGLTKEQVDQMKKDLPKATEEWNKNKEENLAKLNQVFKNFSVKLSNVVDDKGFIAHSLVNIGLDVVSPDPNSPGEVNFKITAQFTNYNIDGKQTYKNTIPPNAGDIMPMQDLINGFMGVGF